MKIVGLDLSLTSTGVALVDVDTLGLVGTDITVSRALSKGSKEATLAERHLRVHQLRNRVAGLVAKPNDVPALAVVEGPSFGQQRQAGQHDRAGFWWFIVDMLLVNGVPVVEVPPATLKTYVTGKGNAPKDAVLAAAIRRWPDVEITGNDEADALVLAAMGARHLGYPIDDMPTAHLRAMDKVRWSA